MPLVDVGGFELYYESHGEHAGTPLVLITGLAGSCRGWLPLQVPAFSSARRTLIFDNRGVGRSEEPGGPFTTADMARDAASLLDALEIEKADVLGAFLGGMVAQELALSHPHRVDRLVLVGTYARPDAKRRLLLETWRALPSSGAPREVLLNQRMLWCLQDETLEQSDLIDPMLENFRREGAPLSEDLFVRQCDACLGHDSHDRLRRLRQRTLVLCGRNDQLTPPKFHRELADEIPDARLVTLSYGAHLIEVEAAERFNEIVLQFLAEDRAEDSGS